MVNTHLALTHFGSRRWTKKRRTRPQLWEPLCREVQNGRHRGNRWLFFLRFALQRCHSLLEDRRHCIDINMLLRLKNRAKESQIENFESSDETEQSKVGRKILLSNSSLGFITGKTIFEAIADVRRTGTLDFGHTHI